MHLAKTHSQDSLQPPPSHTIIIKAADLTWSFGEGKRKYTLNEHMQSKIYSQFVSQEIQTSGKFMKSHIYPSYWHTPYAHS